MNINKRSKPNIKIKAKYVPKLVKGADRRNKIITKNFFKTTERKQTFDKLMAEPMELLIAAFTQLTAVEGSPTHIIVHVSTRICSRIFSYCAFLLRLITINLILCMITRDYLIISASSRRIY